MFSPQAIRVASNLPYTPPALPSSVVFCRMKTGRCIHFDCAEKHSRNAPMLQNSSEGWRCFFAASDVCWRDPVAARRLLGAAFDDLHSRRRGTRPWIERCAYHPRREADRNSFKHSQSLSLDNM